VSRFDMKLPDVGEGVAEAEMVEWFVGIGDHVTPDTVIAEVLTDKATVEVSSPVDGIVVELHGEPGDVLAVGGDLIGIQTDEIPDGAAVQSEPEPANGRDEDGEQTPTDSDASHGSQTTGSSRPGGARVTAAPAVRARAAGLDIDLTTIDGTGPDGRVVHADLDRELVGRSGGAGATRTAPPRTAASGTGNAVSIRGVRRQISNRLSAAWNEIPHITYVDDVDMTELERLRSRLNDAPSVHGVRLTLLPFLARALVVAVADQPGLNAHYDHPSETLTTYDAVHIGVATQTDDGLRVPVVRHAESHGIWSLAAEIGRVAAAARDGSATRDELAGSTITITSLGAAGGLVTTPIINPPEVAIIGVNKMETRPVWRDGTFQPRQVMNLSSSFDHRMIDGWDAATFIQHIKELLETPALLFIDDN
jgi:2-oxoisovalerate dehydrogenase E2 component (dihydrolipoyl transacylase)